MHSLRRKLYSQNFLHSRRLVASLVASSSINTTDLVLEVGPGKGIITEQLIARAAHVMAVEIDSHYYQTVKTRFATVPSLAVYHEDFLNFTLPKISYKVFANLPFAIEGKIIRKLIDSNNPPIDSYLIVVKDLAERLSGIGRENQFSLCHKPWFNFEIVYSFKRTDFSPWPSVDAVLFRITKREAPLLPESNRQKFSAFIASGFGQGLSVFKNLSKKYRQETILHCLSKYGFNKNTLPNRLSVYEWIGLYNFLLIS